MDWPTAGTVGGLAVIVMAGLLYLIRAEIAKTKADLATLRPNGGSSMADKVDTILQRQGEVIDDLAYMRRRLDAHIDWHLNE